MLLSVGVSVPRAELCTWAFLLKTQHGTSYLPALPPRPPKLQGRLNWLLTVDIFLCAVH